MTNEAMRASRSIMAAERSLALRPYPILPTLPEQSADHHQKVRDETQRRMAELNGTLDRAIARHTPFNPLDHEQTK